MNVNEKRQTLETELSWVKFYREQEEKALDMKIKNIETELRRMADDVRREHAAFFRRRLTKVYGEPGALGSNTLNLADTLALARDLLKMLSDADEIDASDADAQLTAEARLLWINSATKAIESNDEEGMHEALTEIALLLDEFSPPSYRFGPRRVDGKYIWGFWPDEYSAQRDQAITNAHELAANVQHIVAWGLSNLNLSDLTRSAAEVTRQNVHEMRLRNALKELEG